MNMAKNKLPASAYTDLGEATVLNYQLSLKGAERAYRRADADDKKVISGMVSDCEYVIAWLSTGRRPKNKRGIERRAGYEREILLDPIRMQAFASNSKAGSPANLTDDQRAMIEEALRYLSPRQRECYVLAHGECFSQAEIAQMLGITRSSVQAYIEEAQRKVSEELQQNLFLWK
ncbi:sigma factor-like helix-turn-helix DNA-binding protein [Paenibacillus rhizophilus]|uniref:RNA polymerase subunit sigma-24 n=1 Tax=Paenibacillus rhizophilus TaxID=1850366 RepID=A0A3N9PZJ3_9BACL|nr:sigma factor-like helix-turn-helix DNA-binding protein [Paenibacillus rhizophilus]RQW11832.1 RNA polymerase subunit sigma-24 [Paenibacillus rhizophilus]